MLGVVSGSVTGMLKLLAGTLRHSSNSYAILVPHLVSRDLLHRCTSSITS